MKRSTPFLAALVLLAGCTRANPEFVEGAGDGAPPADRGTWDLGPPPEQGPVPDIGWPDLPDPNKKPNGVDVLLVVDNSAGMGYPQQWLSRDIDTLISGLNSLPGGPNYRIGVVTTDMGVGAFANAGCSASGDHAELQVPQSCPAPQGSARYVQRVGGTVNVSTSVEAAVGCYINALGTSGCGFEQPLKAMKAALGQSKGFLRGDAALAVVLLTNEDDCSAASDTLFDPQDTALGPYTSYRCFQYGVLCNGQQPPLAQTLLAGCVPGQNWLLDVQSEYVGFLQGAKPKGWVSLLALVGPTAKQVTVLQTSYNPPRYNVKETCSYGSLEGYPGFRLQQLVAGLGPLAAMDHVCNNNYRPALQSLVLRVQSAF